MKVILTAMTGMIVAVSTNLPSYTRSPNYVTCVILVMHLVSAPQEETKLVPNFYGQGIGKLQTLRLDITLVWR
jgi:hypothetical protein